MSALINALLISLFALLPDNDLSRVCFALGVIGLTSTLGLALVLQGAKRLGVRALRQWVLLIGLLALYVVQLLLSGRIDGEVADADAVNDIGVLVVIFFAIGIARAWELVGVPETGLIRTLRRRQTPSSDRE